MSSVDSQKKWSIILIIFYWKLTLFRGFIKTLIAKGIANSCKCISFFINILKLGSKSSLTINVYKEQMQKTILRALGIDRLINITRISWSSWISAETSSSIQLQTIRACWVWDIHLWTVGIISSTVASRNNFNNKALKVCYGTRLWKSNTQSGIKNLLIASSPQKHNMSCSAKTNL